jgi:hypothetical protein
MYLSILFHSPFKNIIYNTVTMQVIIFLLIISQYVSATGGHLQVFTANLLHCTYLCL